MITDMLEKIDLGREIAPDVLCLPILFTNVFLIGTPKNNNGDWVLLDAGLAKYENRIIEAAESRFGRNSHLKSIILTHGHFDHIGTIKELLKTWDVPVYAHELELPYLTGQADYAPADPTVGGGLMAQISPLYPHKGIDLGSHVHPLPLDRSVPDMPNWRWIHTPGHTKGHISLFRDSDRTLIAGDAFTTVKQESAEAVITQRKEIHGPPAYFTTDWEAAHASVNKLRELKPQAAATGHGHPIFGKELSNKLDLLSREFDTIAIPNHGIYV